MEQALCNRGTEVADSSATGMNDSRGKEVILVFNSPNVCI